MTQAELHTTLADALSGILDRVADGKLFVTLTMTLQPGTEQEEPEPEQMRIEYGDGRTIYSESKTAQYCTPLCENGDEHI